MRKVGIVTGAASGLGLEFAHLLARDSFDLILFDIDGKRLKDVKALLESKYDTRISNFSLDLSKPFIAKEVYGKLNGSGIDVLINNAGFGLFGHFTKTSWQHEEAMIQLHIMTTTQLTKLILKDMVAKGSGKILNVASVAAFLPGPLMTIYYATKAYIVSFSQALANEVRGTGVSVTVLCPGQTKTGFQNVESSLSNVKPSSTKYFTSDALSVAKYGYRAMNAGRALAVPGIFNKFILVLSRILPMKISGMLVRKLQENVRP